MNGINWLKKAQELEAEALRWRRTFHRYPELGFKEINTAAQIAAELERLKFIVKKGIAETGVIGVWDTNRPGATVMVRFDMDALPIQEENECDYASQNPGIMHACGHDGHMAVGLTLAKIISSNPDFFKGKIKLLFQPAEEGLGGAERVISEGGLRDPKPDICFGLHLWNEKPVGWFGITEGPVMAGADIFHVRISGKGGHGAMPERTKDPILACAQIITAIQSVISRRVSAQDTAVLSVTKILAGETFNVIPGHAEFDGTIRYFEETIHQLLTEQFMQLVNGIAQAFGCTSDIEINSLTPAVDNDSNATRLVREALSKLGYQGVVDSVFRTMGSEDMAFYLQQIPGCYFFIGSANENKNLIYGHHHPRFDFDESVIVYAAALLAEVVSLANPDQHFY